MTAKGRKFDSFSDSLVQFLNVAILQPSLKEESKDATLDFIDTLLEKYPEASVQQSIQEAEQSLINENRENARIGLEKDDLELAEGIQSTNAVNKQIDQILTFKQADVQNEKVRDELLKIGFNKEDAPVKALEPIIGKDLVPETPSPGFAGTSGDSSLDAIAQIILGENKGQQERGREFLLRQRDLFSQEQVTPEAINILTGLNRAIGGGRGAQGRSIAERILETQLQEQIRFGPGAERRGFEQFKAEQRIGEFGEKEEERRKSQKLKNEQIVARMKIAKDSQNRFEDVRSDVRIAVENFKAKPETRDKMLKFLEDERAIAQRSLEAKAKEAENVFGDVEQKIIQGEANDIRKTITEIDKAIRSINLLDPSAKPKKLTSSQALRILERELAKPNISAEVRKQIQAKIAKIKSRSR